MNGIVYLTGAGPGDYRLLTHADSYRLEDTDSSPTEDAEVTVPAGVHAIP